jgi:hypothetical protein
MSQLPRQCALAAALVSLVVGVHDATRIPPPTKRAPAPASVLAPLARAPLPAGSFTALAPSAESNADKRTNLFYEAVYRRPDLRWGMLDGWPAQTRPTFLVTLGATEPPRGWHEFWRAGQLRIFVWKPQ